MGRNKPLPIGNQLNKPLKTNKMHVISHGSSLYSAMSLTEARIQHSAYKALNKQYEENRVMTPRIKDVIITALLLLDDHITAITESVPELPQKVYDDFSDAELLEIF